MVKLYFVCMGNYYRSRLAEELAYFYAAKYGVDIISDSGGLSKIPNPDHLGSMASATLRYLAAKNIIPKGIERMPKGVSIEDINDADIVVCTDAAEQGALFKQRFPDFKGQLIGWNARDHMYDELLQTPVMIDKKVEELIKTIKEQLCGGFLS